MQNCLAILTLDRTQKQNSDAKTNTAIKYIFLALVNLAVKVENKQMLVSLKL